MKLPERWQKVIEQNGKYIIDYSLFLVFKKMCLICMKKSAITSGTTQYVILYQHIISKIELSKSCIYWYLRKTDIQILF